MPGMTQGKSDSENDNKSSFGGKGGFGGFGGFGGGGFGGGGFSMEDIFSQFGDIFGGHFGGGFWRNAAGIYQKRRCSCLLQNRKENSGTAGAGFPII